MKKVSVVTGTRAEYGLLRWVIDGLHHSQTCDLQIVATGMHLAPEFGSTWKAIKADGYPIARKVEMLLSSDSPVGISKSMGLGMAGFADALHDLNPDLVVILGDRFEMLSVAAATMIANIPIAHLHGGELTEGLYDDPIRHAITKMSYLHFTAAEPYRQRVIQMGEDPSRVWNVGGLGIDSIVKIPRMERSELESSLGFTLGQRNLLVTFHPETNTGNSVAAQMNELLCALQQTDASLIFTMPNADTGGRTLFDQISKFVAANPDRACAHVSLGQRRYLSLLALVDGVVGNSSSGLIEAPALQVPTLNIGARQQGRLRADSVIDCGAERGAISTGLERIFSPDFRKSLPQVVNPYGDGGASVRIVEAIERWTPDRVSKRFYDLAISPDKVRTQTEEAS
ncbi:UDP-N-acetylglucosamine 2-epimerase (hydrolyzing) [Erythrobacter citreus]|uniref:GDP/UDP-N,N'-diacetylbacillosamine 2-epimerase (Hydrolyzing) n=1 Tax=Qipengyuania citrea TaxID=225971 RepID=A0A6I4UEP4_9SPHN|nr:UDP-N-acetylglucosamine 2-epimerase [Qipengyuania citrea]MDQ0567352.1 GDP/UDP-N,N'-diacetylbacillosamine 2-epimerase (hydrolyzing) [Qipengyuania citrea]MXP36896.1 UDP-N-acetylglucosamine 2-epimerase (hydrolyzing) [Qipengyuania citrea]